jgi:hypothetical protein
MALTTLALLLVEANAAIKKREPARMPLALFCKMSAPER